MSKHRENVVWPSPGGTWNIGFYRCEVQWWKDDPDPEWDVEYDYGEFAWLSRGHGSRAAAIAAWKGANPGQHMVVFDGDAGAIAQLEEVAARYRY
jgi:hypothetical protein